MPVVVGSSPTLGTTVTSRWRNWQTRRSQIPVVVGSSPTLGTTDTSGWRNWQTRQVEILSVVGSSPIPGTAVSTFIDFLKNGQFL